MLDLNYALEKAKEIAIKTGEYQLSKFERKIEFHSKSTDVDMVTEVDVNSEKMIVDGIKKYFPDHFVMTEESGSDGEGEYTWIIDPLDGTNSYLHGFPFFCISIALKRGKEIVLGVVYAPRLKELFYAVKGGGAYRDGEKISVSKVDEFKKALLVTGFPYDKNLTDKNNLDIFCKIVPQLQGIRRTGSAALDLCSIACGRIDGYWELKLFLWDMAAGELILKEAGGEVLTYKMKRVNGTTGINIIAGNEKMVELLYNEINKTASYFFGDEKQD